MLAGFAAAAFVLVALGGWYLMTRPPARGGHPIQPQAVVPEPDSTNVAVEPTPPPATATQDNPSPAEATSAKAFAAPSAATKRWTNSLGQVFVPVPGTKVAFALGYAGKGLRGVHGGQEPGWMGVVKRPDFEQGETHPVVNVSWYDAKAFCQ